MSDGDVKNARTPISQAFHDGYVAGRRGRTGADNPYKSGTREARAWLKGLLHGRAKRLMLVQDS
jgi:ribosome modulation factor